MQSRRARDHVLTAVLVASAAWLAARVIEYAYNLGGIERHHVESAVYLFAAVAFITALVVTPAATLPSRRFQRPVILALAFVASSWLLYGDTASLGLFSDDFVLLDRAHRHEWIGGGEFVRPVPSMLWSLVDALTRSSVPLHAINITLHGLNAALVVLLGSALGLSSGASIVAGALFLAYPIAVETVVWPAGVQDLAVAGCALAFVLLSLKPASPLNVVLGVAVLLLALSSKESAIAIPALAAAFWVAHGPPRTSARLLVIGGFAICAIYALARLTLLPPDVTYAQPPDRYLLKELLARPIAALAFPWSVTDTGVATLEVIWAVPLIACCAFYSASQERAIAPSTSLRLIAALFIAVLPVYSLLFIAPDLQNTRYVYLSSAFWALFVVGLAAGIGRSHTKVRLLAAALLLAIAVLGVRLHVRPWYEAADLRNRVLASAASLDARGCRDIAFNGAPDSIRGAYVFRNGLPEALALRGIAAAPSKRADCVFAWNGQTFERK